MSIELKINGIDASTLGVRMSGNFLSDIAAPTSLKDFIDNESRLENGVQRIHNSPKYASRDVTLEFAIIGKSESDFLAKLNAFKNILYAGQVTIHIPVLGETYYMTYQRSQNFSFGNSRMSAKISVKLNEANPANRT